MFSVFLCWYIALAGFGLCLTRDLEFTSRTTFVDSTRPFFIVCFSFLVTSEDFHISTALMRVSFTSLSKRSRIRLSFMENTILSLLMFSCSLNSQALASVCSRRSAVPPLSHKSRIDISRIRRAFPKQIQVQIV